VPDTPPARILLEIAVDDVEGAVAAAAAGADRVELCGCLDAGGTTPSVGLLAAVRARVEVPLFAMIRPRGGDFVYSPAEHEVMLRDIEACRQHRADGLALGALTGTGAVDVPAMRALVAAAGRLPVTFHRAFDDATDHEDALEEVIGLGCARVLTTGRPGAQRAEADGLRTLVGRAAGRVVVVAAGRVRAATVATLLSSGVHEVHAGPRARRLGQSGRLYGEREATDADAVRALAQAVHAAAG